jgi:plastocyanin
MHASRRIAAVLLLPVLGLAVTACSSSDSSSKSKTTPKSASASPAKSTGSTITIKNFMFSTATVKAGQMVTVKNMDSTTHTVTADDGSFNTGDIAAGSSATFTPSSPGSVKYHCNIHNYMTGTLTVTS